MFRSMISRTRWLAAAAILGVLGAGVVSASPAIAQAKKPIKVALVGDLSGNGALITNFRAAESGVKTAVYQINASGGVNGRHLAVTTYDGQSTADLTAVAMRQALGAGPDAIIGASISANWGPSISLLSGAQVPVLVPGALFPGIDNLPFVYGVGVTAQNGAELIVQAVKRLLGGSLKGKVLALEATTPSAIQEVKIPAIKAAMKREGGRVGLVIREPAVVTTWASQAANVMNSKPDAMVVSTAEGTALLIGKALGVAGYKGPILSDTFANSDATISGVNLPNFFALRDSLPITVGSPLYLKVRAAGASPARALAAPANFARGYDAVYALVAGLKKCGSPCSKQKLTSSIQAAGLVSVPLNPFLGSLDFRTSRSGVNFAQIWMYSPAAKKPVAKGSTIFVK